MIVIQMKAYIHTPGIVSFENTANLSFGQFWPKIMVHSAYIVLLPSSYFIIFVLIRFVPLRPNIANKNFAHAWIGLSVLADCLGNGGVHPLSTIDLKGAANEVGISRESMHHALHVHCLRMHLIFYST
jgi:hypothetical protein